MDTKTFLQLVLPARDFFVLYLAKSEQSKWNENHETLESACAAIARYDATQTTVYFAIGKFANNIEISEKTGKPLAKRRKEMATLFKTLCCDIDVGEDHKYKDQKSAVTDLLKACEALGLPFPMIVSSGRGVHAYWPLNAEIGADLWEKMSIALRNALHAKGVDLDASKVHDRSMVLRPAGTHHKKNPDNWLPVQVKLPQEPLDPMALAKALTPYKSAVPLKSSKKSTSKILGAVLGGDLPPIVLDDMRKCNQLNALIESGGVTDAVGGIVYEPMWRHSMGVAKFCEDPRAAAYLFGGGHPKFDIELAMEKINGWHGTGATKCASFAAVCPEGCNACPHKGKIGSPASLSRGAVEVVATNPETGEAVVHKMPEGYSVRGGAVIFTPPDSDDPIFVSPYTMYVVARFTDVGEKQAVAKVAVAYPVEGTKIIDLDVATIAGGGAELSKALALKQIYTYGDNKHLRQYLMTYLKELQKTEEMEFYYRQYGWQEDGSFLGSNGVIGGTTDAAHTHYEGPIEEMRPFIRAEGDLEKWVRGTQMFGHPELLFHGVAFLAMAGSVLMKGSGLSSALVNMYSKDSGSGKTLTARYGLSIWGKPSKLMHTVNDTDNALYKRLGILNSLGLYIDEITTMDADRTRAFVYTLPEGREKVRVTQSAEGFRNVATWDGLCFASSNKDINDLARISSEAERLRVLQLPFDRVSFFEEEGSSIGYKLSRFLDANYGVAGPKIVEAILKRGGQDAVYSDAHDRLESKYKFVFLGQERFYKAIAAVIEGISTVLVEEGLIAFDPEPSIRRLLDHIVALREDRSTTTMDGLDIVFQFLTDHADRIVHYREAQTKTELKQFVVEPIPRTAMGRTEVVYDDKTTFLGGKMFINRMSFKKWCLHNGAEFSGVMASLRQQGVRVRDNVRKTLYKGVPGQSASGQTYCLELDLASHARFVEANTGGTQSPMLVTPRLQAA
jgi:hypothetical protein